jgi:peroxiredoxin Q/BCP
MHRAAMRYDPRLPRAETDMTRFHRSLVFAIALTAAASASAALAPGTRAPSFQAPAYLAGKPFTFALAEALKKGPVVVYFFPAAHTKGCNLEAHLFSEAIEDFKAEGATVIGVTAGNTHELAAFSQETEHCGGKFAVAADEGAKIAAKYDALLEAKPEWASRTSYVVGRDGRIAFAYSEPNPTQHVAKTLAALRALPKAARKPK